MDKAISAVFNLKVKAETRKFCHVALSHGKKCLPQKSILRSKMRIFLAICSFYSLKSHLALCNLTAPPPKGRGFTAFSDKLNQACNQTHDCLKPSHHIFMA